MLNCQKTNQKQAIFYPAFYTLKCNIKKLSIFSQIVITKNQFLYNIEHITTRHEEDGFYRFLNR